MPILGAQPDDTQNNKIFIIYILYIFIYIEVYFNLKLIYIYILFMYLNLFEIILFKFFLNYNLHIL